jgi:hypothetical protein
LRAHTRAHTSCACCTKSNAGKYYFTEFDTGQNVGEWLRSCVHAREGMIVSTCTCTSWHDCARVCIMYMCSITIMCTYARGRDCA